MLRLTIPALDVLLATTCPPSLSAPLSYRLSVIRRYKVLVPLNAADIDTGTEDSTLTGGDKPKKEKSKTPGATPFDLLDSIIIDTTAAKSIKKNVAKARQNDDPIKKFVQSQLPEQEIDSIGVSDEADLELNVLVNADKAIEVKNKAEREDIEELQEEEDYMDGSEEPTIVEEADTIINKDISDPLDAKSVMEMLNGTGVSVDGNGMVDDATKKYICTTKLLMRSLMRETTICRSVPNHMIVGRLNWKRIGGWGCSTITSFRFVCVCIRAVWLPMSTFELDFK